MKRNDFWLWCHPAGSFSGRNWGAGLEGSTIEPGAAGRSMGIHNGIMVRSWSKPETAEYPQYMKEMSSFHRMLWSVIGDFGSRTSPFDDLAQVVAMKEHYPSISGIMLDDFFPPDGMPSFTEPRLTVAEMARLREVLDQHAMEAWAVVYEGQLDQRLAGHLPFLDTLNFWTWFGEHIGDQERNVEKLRRLAPEQKIMFGIYMWDFGNQKPLEAGQMDAQFQSAELLFRRGLIHGAVILASCMCDLELEAVRQTRQYLMTL